MRHSRRIVDEIWEDAAADKLKVCRKDMQRRLKLLAPANDQVSAERLARDLLLKRCRKCGDCWMARL